MNTIKFEHLLSWSGYLRCLNDETSSGMQSSEEKCRAQMSIIYGRTVLWNLNEENEAEKNIFLVDGAPWYLLAFGQKRHECIALTCNHGNSVVIYIYIAILIVIIVIILTYDLQLCQEKLQDSNKLPPLR